VINVDDLNLRIPNGNETSANKYFVPGGFTKNGRMEAGIDAIPRIRYTSVIN